MGHLSAPQRWLRLVCVCVLSALPFLAPAPSRADEADPPGYRGLVEDGLREFGVQNYEEARALFLRAHALHPNARTHRALGLAEFELRNYAQSIAHLQEAISSPSKPLSDALKRDAEKVLERAYGFVARVQVRLRPAGQLLVDGENIGHTSERALILRIGEHELEAQADGFASKKRTLDVKGGEELTVNFSLVTAGAQASHGDDDQDASGADKPVRRWYKSPWFWVPTAIILAGAAGGTAYALTRDRGGNDYNGSTGVSIPGP